jgi:hypothetical protein
MGNEVLKSYFCPHKRSITSLQLISAQILVTWRGALIKVHFSPSLKCPIIEYEYSEKFEAADQLH